MPIDEECNCLRCTLGRLVLDAVEAGDGKPSAPDPLTRLGAEFMRDLIDNMSSGDRRTGAVAALRMNDKVAGTDQELPIDIANHFRAIVAEKPVSETHPLEVVDPPIGGKWGCR